MCACWHVHAHKCRPQEGVRGPGAGVRGVVRRLLRALGTELGSSAGAAYTVNCRAICPVKYHFLVCISILFLILCVWVFCMHASLCTLFVWCPWRPEDGAGVLVTGIIELVESPCRSWELNLGPLEEQPVLLTAEPALQSPNLFLRWASHGKYWKQVVINTSLISNTSKMKYSYNQTVQTHTSRPAWWCIALIPTLRRIAMHLSIAWATE
jgi:hypothetical protein